MCLTYVRYMHTRTRAYIHKTPEGEEADGEEADGEEADGGEAQSISSYLSYIYAIHKIHALTQAYKNAYVQTYIHTYPKDKAVENTLSYVSYICAIYVCIHEQIIIYIHR